MDGSDCFSRCHYALIHAAINIRAKYPGQRRVRVYPPSSGEPAGRLLATGRECYGGLSMRWTGYHSTTTATNCISKHPEPCPVDYPDCVDVPK